MLTYEAENDLEGIVAGVDEAGRGPLAGPVVAGAVILILGEQFKGLDDSKKVSPENRDRLFDVIRERAVAWGIGVVDVQLIDKINILQAARLAMKEAVENMLVIPDLLLIDGKQPIDSPIKQKTLVKGDQRSISIAAASIMAKVTRDRMMLAYHKRYPHYAFDRHKGYGTSLHLEKILEHGPCPIHRRTFKGVGHTRG